MSGLCVLYVYTVKMEEVVTADQLFQVVNPVALLGWIVLIAGIIFKKPLWRDIIAGQVFPTVLSLVYTMLIVFFWAKAEGGFDTLPNVQKLFTYPWAALAGWVHYLAFDLFVGAHISRRVMEDGLPRLILIALLPLTFLFGPIGYFGFQICRLLFRRVSAAS
jgi:Domain of unknown function (DUF4281)